MPSGELQAKKTHCPQGHEYTLENTYYQTKRDRNRERRNRVCRECARIRKQIKLSTPEGRAYETEKMRRWREANPERNRQNWTENRRRKKEWLDTQKVSCNRCGFDHIAALEFHHRNPAEKDFLLSVAVAHYSIDRLKVEVEKCEVLCSNCHRIHHYDEKHKTE